MTDFDTSLLVGRWSDLVPDRTEVKALATGMDFREPQYRREVFLRFYEFHLRWRTHPGCVYLLFPKLLAGRPMEDWLWFAFINGLTQNPVTTMIIFQHFPEVPREERRLQELDDWFNQNWARLAFDTDRRYQKKDFPAAVRAYSTALASLSQEEFFSIHLLSSPTASFDSLWKVVDKQFVSFGRLSTWSYLEYLFICGLDLEPSSMMLRDMSGSKSHRNGLAIVLGRDDLDWRKDTTFQGKYRPEVLEWLEVEADKLLSEMRNRYPQDRPWAVDCNWDRHISRFTLESALCTYKGWHRPNRRYPNVYTDMLYDRIRRGEQDWPSFDFSPFWEARRSLSSHLLLEDNPDDPGLQRIKQNHYRLTGQVIMMDQDWAVFKNDGSWRVGR